MEYDSEWIRQTHEEEYLREGRDPKITTISSETIDEKKFQSMTRPKVNHYLQGSIEPIDFINSHGFNFNLGNAIKYITRCNHKGTKREDLQKAIDYINFELEKEQ